MGTGNTRILTAETKEGRLAIEEVMRNSYDADADSVPSEWALVRVADGAPVSFILIDPEREMAFPDGGVRYAFICDVATRKDRRREGHFRAILEEAFSKLRTAGIPLVVTHGRYQLYRQFGFDVFTHHCGIFIRPELVERSLGASTSETRQRLVIEDREAVQDDLLLVTDVKANTLPEMIAALQEAAALARKRAKARILFEHPPAPSYGSRYPMHPSLETPFTALARACGAQICTQAADPEGGAIPDADWIKVLDTVAFLGAALPCLEQGGSLPAGKVCFDTDAGAATLESRGAKVQVSSGTEPGASIVRWPASAMAQLVTGYHTAEALSAMHDTSLSDEVLALLGSLFPQRWRLSRNESWTFKS